MNYFIEDWLPWALGAAIVAILVLLGTAAYHEGKQWDAFKVAHACKVVGKMSGDMVTTVAPVIGGNGGVVVGVSSTPSKTGWLCDDGVTYWR